MQDLTSRAIFARKIRELRGYRTYRQFEKDIKEKTGFCISFSMLRQYEDPKGSDPRHEVIDALAKFANKPVSWFYESDQSITIAEARERYLTSTGNVYEDKRRRQLLELFERRFSSVSNDQIEAYIRALDNLIELASKVAIADEEDEKK